MKESVASSVRAKVARKAVRSFLTPADFSGSPRAVEVELSRIAAKGDLTHIRKGLYWKGPRTRLGMTPPRPMSVALYLAGPGSGPAGFTAAAALGLTTQVPATAEIAVPSRVPSPIPGVRFTSRHSSRRELRLTAEEVALVEVLKDWPVTVEASWRELAKKTSELVESGSIRPERVTRDVEAEHRPAIREGWDRLRLELEL